MLVNPSSVAAEPPRKPVDLADADERQRLGIVGLKAYRRLAAAWDLTGLEAAALLGVSERQWSRLKSTDLSIPPGQDMLTRISAAVGIYKGLHLLFSEPLSDEWPGLINQGVLFNGARPIDIMMSEGIPAMVEVRSYIDALRGGI